MGSDFLFAMPSALAGVSRSLDLGATFGGYNESQTEREADRRALCSDWYVVGDSLSDAINTFSEEEPAAALQALTVVKVEG